MRAAAQGGGAIIAAVGAHGREWWTRFAWSALALAALSAPAAAQPSASFVDLAPDLA